MENISKESPAKSAKSPTEYNPFRKKTFEYKRDGRFVRFYESEYSAARSFLPTGASSDDIEKKCKKVADCIYLRRGCYSGRHFAFEKLTIKEVKQRIMIGNANKKGYGTGYKLVKGYTK